ncbi:MAG TPA: hypothetical protein VKN36_01235 [Eudoraea sp.]|nr:hypothetical protein [Eudoraea sp.]
MTLAKSLKRLGFIVFILCMQNLWAQPHPLWDIELDVHTIFSAPYDFRNEEEIPISVSVVNCKNEHLSELLGGLPMGLYNVKVTIDISFEGLELPPFEEFETSSEIGTASIRWVEPKTLEYYVRYSCWWNFTYVDRTEPTRFTFFYKILDKENAWFKAEVVDIEWISGWSMLDLDLWSNGDVDSSPNNGVDTDGDGNFSNDPDDEDDADGLKISDMAPAMKPLDCQCLDSASDDLEEPVTANPEVVGESVEGSTVGSGGLSTVGNPTPPGGTNPLGNPATPGSAPSGTLDAEAGCMIGANVPSPMAPNPEGTEGIFRFDYKIESIARASFIDGGRRQTMDLSVNYYVNSNDGSLFFSTDTGGFFGANAFATSDRMGRIDGVVQKADGQQVIYGLENPTSTLRAVVVAQDQTAADVAGKKQLNVSEFMNSLGSTTLSPDPLPPHLAAKWGNVPGYVGRMNDVSGTKSTVTIYMGRSPDIRPIPTNSPLVGFLVGIFKDHVQADCNKLAFYTRMTSDGSDDYLEVELVHIEPASIEFDGTPYKLTQWGAVPGSTARTRMQALQGRMEALALSKEAAKTARRNCAPNDTACYDQYTRQMEQLERELEDLECQIACDMGLEEYADNCTCP